MENVVVLALLAGLAVAGAVVHRSWFALVPLAIWPLFYAGLHEGWWFYGVGDGWQYVAVFVTLLSVALTGAGIVFGRTARDIVHETGGNSRHRRAQ